MAQTGLDVFDRTMHETNTWLKEIGAEMGHPDRQMAYHALRGVLFTLRDRLLPEQAVKLSAQLPTMIRGIYFEGYQLAKAPVKHSREEFVQHVRRELEQAGGANPEHAIRAVFTVLSRHVSSGEVKQVRDMLPKQFQQLWPEEVLQS